jgi:hypothetical protein
LKNKKSIICELFGPQISSIFLVLTGNKMFWDLPPGTPNTCKELDVPDDEGVEPRDYMPYSYMIMAEVSILLRLSY